MSVFDNDLQAMDDDRLANLERYYLTLQNARALTNNEATRLNAILMEQHLRNVARADWDNAVGLCS